MNKFIVVYDDNKTYKTLKESELIKEFGKIEFHKLSDLIHGEFDIYYHTPRITIYNMLTNNKFKKFKIELNLFNYLYKN